MWWTPASRHYLSCALRSRCPVTCFGQCFIRTHIKQPVAAACCSRWERNGNLNSNYGGGKYQSQSDALRFTRRSLAGYSKRIAIYRRFLRTTLKAFTQNTSLTFRLCVFRIKNAATIFCKLSFISYSYDQKPLNISNISISLDLASPFHISVSLALVSKRWKSTESYL